MVEKKSAYFLREHFQLLILSYECMKIQVFEIV
jgi:hypothetical protein